MNYIKRSYILLFLFVIFSIARVYSQTDKEFWFAVPDITSGNCVGGTCPGDEPIYLRLSACKLDVNVSVSIPAAGLTIEEITIPANSTYTVNLSPFLANLENTNYGIVDNKGLHIVADNLINAFYELGEINNPDIFSLKGNNALGKEFYTPFQNEWNNANIYTPTPYSGFVIVATKDNTTVNITPTQDIKGGNLANIPFAIILDEGQTYACVADGQNAADHLSGSYISSDEPIAVTIYDDSGTHISGLDNDLSGDQIVPVGIVGMQYIAIKGDVTSDEKVFILATENATTVDIDNGTATLNLANAGDTKLYALVNHATIINADKPVYVLHLTGYGSQLGASLLPTIDGCTGSSVVNLFRPTTQAFYLNLMIREGTAKSQFYIEYEDGTSFNIPPEWFEPVKYDSSWLVLKKLKSLFANSSIDGGIPYNEVTRIRNTEDIFHVGFNNGAATTGCSYAFFSNYKGNRGNVEESITELTNIQKCFGEPIQLVATGGVFYIWSPATYLNDRYSPIPIVNAIPGTYHYDVYIDRACYADTVIGVDITVSDYIYAQFTPDKNSGCAPLDINVTDNSVGALLAKYEWWYDYDGSSPADVLGVNSISHTYTNNSDTTKIFKMRLRVENSDGCADSLIKDIVVQPFISADFEPVDTVNCNPVEIQFRNLTTGGNLDSTLYSWDFGDGGTSNDSIPYHIFINTSSADTIYITQLITESKFGCKDTAETNVSVHEYIKADFTIDTVEACSPLSVNINHNTYPGVNSYTWDFDDGSTFVGANPPSHTYTNTSDVIDTFQLKLVVDNDNNCKDSLIRQIVVFPEVLADFSPLVPAPIGCNTFEIDFNNNSVYSGTASNTDLLYSWDFGDGGTSNILNPSHEFVNVNNIDSVFNVNLYVESPNGCFHDTSTTVTVHSFLDAKFTVDIVQACSPLTVTINNNSEGGITNYYWDFDGDDVSDSILSDNVFTKTYHNTSGSPIENNLRLVVANINGCTDTLIRKITVFSEVTADFLPVNTLGCNPDTIDFINNSSVWATDYIWDFGDGGTSNEKNPKHIFENSSSNDTVFNVEMIAITVNNCKDTMNTNVTVHEYLNANFVVDNPVGCAPFLINITNNSEGGISSYAWDYDDGSPIDNTSSSYFTHTYNNSTLLPITFNLKLEIQNDNGCKNALTREITAYPEVIADFSIDNVADCHPLNVQFTNLSIIPEPAIYSWTFGDGASSDQKDPMHTFNNFSNTTDITKTIKLIATSDYFCADTIEKNLTIFHNPKADFNIDKTADCPPLVINLENTAVGANNYNWIFGDGVTDNSGNINIEHTYPINTTSNVIDYNLKFIVSTNNLCKDSSSLVLNVYPKVTANFTMDSTGCNPFSVEFENQSENADLFTWDFGDGVSSSLNNPVHKFNNNEATDTNFTVELLSKSQYDCADSVEHQITVYPAPVARFAVTPSLQVFPNSIISVDNTTNVGSWDFLWDFDDDNTSTQRQPGTHTYDHWGEYDILLSVSSNHCSDEVSHKIVIIPPEPVAAFSATPLEGCVPLTVNFTDHSTFDEEHLWDFDDGSTSTEENPVHTYTEAGTYYIKETISGEGGEDYAYKTIRAYKLPIADFNVGPELVMLPDEEIHAFDLSKYGEKYFWNFGDGVSSDEQNPTHLYTLEGEYDVSLIVTSEKGCTDSLSKSRAITVVGEGIIQFPTAFTPSKAGSNGGYYNQEEDNNYVFHPVGAGIIKYELTIFNRWGEIVFETNDVNIGWDGYINDKIAKQDVYIWKVKGKFSNGRAFEKAGDVTLIR